MKETKKLLALRLEAAEERERELRGQLYLALRLLGVEAMPPLGWAKVNAPMPWWYAHVKPAPEDTP